MSDRVTKTHLRAIKNRLNELKDNIEGYQYWTNKNKVGVVELEKEYIKKHLSIIKSHLEYLGGKEKLR